jgi:hypothetical protein
VDTLVGRARDNDDIEHRRSKKNQHPSLCCFDVQVKNRQQWCVFSALGTSQPPAVKNGADRNQDQPYGEDHRQDQVGQYTQVRAAFEAPEFHSEKTCHENQRGNRNRGADQTDCVVRNGYNEVLEHCVPHFSVKDRVGVPEIFPHFSVKDRVGVPEIFLLTSLPLMRA